MAEKKTEKTPTIDEVVREKFMSMTIADRLSTAQKEFKKVEMDKIGKVFYNSGPVEYPYASLNSILDAIRPSLNKYGLALMQDVAVDYSMMSKGGEFIPRIKCKTSIHCEDKSIVSTGMVVMAKNSSPQSVGAAVTYARRYDLAAFMGISAEEDSDAAPAQPEAGESMPVPTSPPPTPPANQQGKPDQIVVNGVVRYDRKSKQLNKAFQEANGLINDQQLQDIQKSVVQQLNGNFNQFQNWLRGKFGVEFYDIGADVYGVVIGTMVTNPSEIINWGANVQQSGL